MIKMRRLTGMRRNQSIYCSLMISDGLLYNGYTSFVLFVEQLQTLVGGVLMTVALRLWQRTTCLLATQCGIALEVLRFPRPMNTALQMFKAISKWRTLMHNLLNHASGRRNCRNLLGFHSYSWVPRVKRILGSGHTPATKNKLLSRNWGNMKNKDSLDIWQGTIFRWFWHKAVGKTWKDPNLPRCNIHWTQLPIHKHKVLQDMKDLLEIAHLWHFCPRSNSHTKHTQTYIYIYMYVTVCIIIYIYNNFTSSTLTYYSDILSGILGRQGSIYRISKWSVQRMTKVRTFPVWTWSPATSCGSGFSGFLLVRGSGHLGDILKATPKGLHRNNLVILGCFASWNNSFHTFFYMFHHSINAMTKDNSELKFSRCLS